jgi:hypothetical protein
MSKRQEVLQFARMAGIKITSGRYAKADCASSPMWVNAISKNNGWADCFASWDETHAFFLAKSQDGTRPWQGG